MIELIIHGRGGMGAVTASKILAEAAILSENYPEVSAFPSFGTERRGAPVQAFCRISDAPIWTRTQIAQADYAIVLDETVLNANVISQVKPGGAIVLNTPKCPEDARAIFNIRPNITIVTSDLTQIAFDLKLTTSENLPIINNSVLGVISKSYIEISMEDVAKAIENKFGKSKKTDLNIKAAQMAADSALVEEAA